MLGLLVRLADLLADTLGKVQRVVTVNITVNSLAGALRRLLDSLPATPVMGSDDFIAIYTVLVVSWRIGVTVAKLYGVGKWCVVLSDPTKFFGDSVALRLDFAYRHATAIT